MDALLPDFDMLLFNCCKEGEALCHAADFFFLSVWRTSNLQILLCSEANKRKQKVEERDDV